MRRRRARWPPRRGADRQAHERLLAIAHRADQERRARRARDSRRRTAAAATKPLGATVLPREYGRVVSVRGRSTSAARRPGLVPGSRRRSRAADRRSRTSGRGPDERHRGTRRQLSTSRRRTTTPAIGPRGPKRCRSNWPVTIGQARLGAPAPRRGAGWPRAACGCTAAPTASATPKRRPSTALAGHAVPLASPDASRGRLDSTRTLSPPMKSIEPLPDDLPTRTHFFWTSGTLFLAP